MLLAVVANAAGHPFDPIGDALKRNFLNAGRFALTGVAAASLCFFTPSVLALGLGRLAVQSALGESLRAEIDVTSMTPEEASNLRVRIAPPESYRAAGVDYNAVLPATQAVLLRRADGRPYLRLSSDRAVQEPFVDVILELTWSTGRLVREYTLLFDPPSNRAMAAAPVPAAPAAPAAPAIASPSPGPASEPPAIVARPAERKPAMPKPVAAAPLPPRVAEARKSATASADEYRVRAGDSLSRIATRTQRAGISLDQMLVSLYRANPQAFIENNMNRLKSGVVLTLPGADAAKAISATEARQLIHAHSADFGAYRQRLAGAVPEAKTQGTARQATGRVQSTVDDKKVAAAAAPDKLTLSKGASSAKATAVDDKLSKEREKKESEARVAELSRNVDELKRISGGAAPAAPLPAPVSNASSMPAKAAVPAVAVPPVPALAVVEAKPTPAASAAVAAAPLSVKPEASAPAVVTAAASRPSAAAAPARAEPGVIGSLLEDNPVGLAVGGGIVAALVGFGLYRLSRRSKSDSGETSFLESRLQPDSFFGASGGQRIDTRDAGVASSSMSYSLSQLDAIGDVDPVAEADVYLAYGRDLQAEEILKEAMRGSPERLAIRTKLLEVYAKRRDIKGFEMLATQLFGLTRGEGEDWAKAQEFGLQIDPENPLYQVGGAPDVLPGDAGKVVEPLGASTMPQSVLPSPSQFGPDAARVAIAQAAPVSRELDLDLDFDEPASMPTQPAPLFSTPSSAAGLQQGSGRPYDPAPDRSYASAAATPAIPPEPLTFDLSSISLDFDSTTGSVAREMESPNSAAAHLSSNGDEHDHADPLERKLELAEEFRQIGDTEGARDLLQEVAAKASGALRIKAQGMLDDLG